MEAEPPNAGNTKCLVAAQKGMCRVDPGERQETLGCVERLLGYFWAWDASHQVMEYSRGALFFYSGKAKKVEITFNQNMLFFFFFDKVSV